MTPTEIRQKQLALYGQIPQQIRFGVVHFIVFGYPLGGFLRAVFSNDLRATFGAADLASRDGLHALVTWLHSFAPSPCWGSKERIADWLAQREQVIQHCAAMRTGLEIFAELGDSIAESALDAIRGEVVE